MTLADTVKRTALGVGYVGFCLGLVKGADYAAGLYLQNQMVSSFQIQERHAEDRIKNPPFSYSEDYYWVPRGGLHGGAI